MINSFQPRAIRLNKAPEYLGMDKNRFNKEVRPHITEVRYGQQTIAFDRNDLDKWFEHYKISSEEQPIAGNHFINNASSIKVSSSLKRYDQIRFDNAIKGCKPSSKIQQ